MFWLHVHMLFKTIAYQERHFKACKKLCLAFLLQSLLVIPSFLQTNKVEDELNDFEESVLELNRTMLTILVELETMLRETISEIVANQTQTEENIRMAEMAINNVTLFLQLAYTSLNDGKKQSGVEGGDGGGDRGGGGCDKSTLSIPSCGVLLKLQVIVKHTKFTLNINDNKYLFLVEGRL